MNGPTPSLPAVVWIDQADRRRAEALAQRLGGLIVLGAAAAVELLPDSAQLVVSATRLAIRFAYQGSWITSSVGFDDFSGAGGRAGPGAGRDLLLSAVGRPRPGEGLLDGTVGFARDAGSLVLSGWSVEGWERSTIVAALLEDGLQRATASGSGFGAALALRLTLRTGDVVARLRDKAAGPPPAIVYLDPMHPPRRGTALVRKDLRALRRLVGPDDDADRLLPAALACARRRVVVKRPPHGPPLAGTAPTRVVAGRKARFDIYDLARSCGPLGAP